MFIETDNQKNARPQRGRMFVERVVSIEGWFDEPILVISDLKNYLIGFEKILIHMFSAIAKIHIKM